MEPRPRPSSARFGCLHDQAHLALERQRVRIGGATHDLRVIAGVTQDALNLGVARLAHDNHTVALAHQALGRHVDLLDVGAGGIDHSKAALASSLDDLRHHAVRANDHGARCGVVQGVCQTDACLGELAHHDGVMDERAQGVDLSALPCLRRGGQRHVECTLNAVTGAGMRCDFDGGDDLLSGGRGGIHDVLAHG